MKSKCIAFACLALLAALGLGSNNLFKLPFNSYEKMMQALAAKEDNIISAAEFKEVLLGLLKQEYKDEDDMEMFQEIIDVLIEKEGLATVDRYQVESLFKKKNFVYFVEKWKKNMYETILKNVANAEKFEKSWLQQPKRYGLTYKNYKRVVKGETNDLSTEVGQISLEESNDFLNYVTINLKDIPDYGAIFDSFLRGQEENLNRFKFERFMVKVLQPLVDEVDRNMLPSLIKEYLFEVMPEKKDFSKEDAAALLRKDKLESYMKKWKLAMFNATIRLMDLREAEDPQMYIQILKDPVLFGITFENYKIFGGDDEKLNKLKPLEEAIPRTEFEIQEEIEYLTSEFLDAAKEYSETMGELVGEAKKQNKKKDEL